MKLPIPRKGTKYVARAHSFVDTGVPVVIAIRDMLHLAKNSKEVKLMVNNKQIKINNKTVKDIKETIRLFNTIHADKTYILTILPTGRFSFQETKGSSRLCRVNNKKTLQGKKTQVNLHDGTNIVVKDKVNVGDSVELDENNKVKKVLPLEKGKNVFVFSGRSVGKTGKVKSVEGKDVTVTLDDKEVALHMSHLMVQ